MIIVSHYNYCIVNIITTTSVGNTKDSLPNNGKLIYLYNVIMASFIVTIPTVVAVIIVLLVIVVIGILVAGLATYIKYKKKTSNID